MALFIPLPQVVQIATAADYEAKRLLASRAMHTAPHGEPRTPTPAWSGLGFSCSMPEHVIKELEHTRARQAREREVASQSDWFNQSVMGSMSTVRESGTDCGMGDGLPVLLNNHGLSKWVFLLDACEQVNCIINLILSFNVIIALLFIFLLSFSSAIPVYLLEFVGFNLLFLLSLCFMIAVQVHGYIRPS